MSYKLWKDDDPHGAVELQRVLQPSNTTSFTSSTTSLTDDTSNTRPKLIRKKSERMSVRFARMRTRGNERREMENRAEDGEVDPIEVPSHANALRIIKVVSLLLIGACGLVGMVFSKITFVSITSRMYTLYEADINDDDEKSVIFFQLVFILVIPEIVSLGHCLVWGCIGKTSKNFPWPSWKAIALVSICMHLCWIDMSRAPFYKYPKPVIQWSIIAELVKEL